MFCALLTSRYQVSVYRTNGPLVHENIHELVNDFHLRFMNLLAHELPFVIHGSLFDMS